MLVSKWFIIIFLFMWIIGPLTQLLQIVNPKLHKKWRLMEERAFEPEFRWFRLMHQGIAYADMSFLISGVIFIIGAFFSKHWSILFGLYTLSIYVYFGIVHFSQMKLLARNDLNPSPENELIIGYVYCLVFVFYGLFGLWYLWRLI